MLTMKTKPRYRSDISEAIHTTVAGFHRSGLVDNATMRDFDARLLHVPVLTPVQIKCLRVANKVSQAVFACYLNTSASTVEKWETGAKRPSGMANKLLDLVRRHGIAALT